MRAVKRRLKPYDYAMIDISDIQKRYSQFQEGLAPVRDGSEDIIVKEWWLLNISGVSRIGKTFPRGIPQICLF